MVYHSVGFVHYFAGGFLRSCSSVSLYLAAFCICCLVFSHPRGGSPKTSAMPSKRQRPYLSCPEMTVRLIYDDMGCFLTLPKDYPAQLKSFGIECTIFNPFRPLLTVKQNNRDHRKIAVIDGKVAFTGGINLADEYINAIEKHGHWKDASVMVKGKAAWSFTLIFLQMWETCTHIDEDYKKFYPWKDQECPITAHGFVQPYADSPMDTENVGEHVYLQILNNAKNYVYINTPYLIVDDSMVSALCLAAKSGVDVRIVTPHRWDKWLVHMTTRSYYRTLIEAGVKIYEYTNGFIHSKTFVSDDHIATVGTTNLDFRSLPGQYSQVV